MKHVFSAAIAALWAGHLGGELRVQAEGWRPGASERPFEVDVRDEVEGLLRTNRNTFNAWRHRITGQARVFDLPDDCGVRCVQFDRRGRLQAHPDGAGKVLRRSFGETLQWLRNADPVTP